MLGPENAKKVNGWFMPSDEKHFEIAINKAGSYQKKHRDFALSFVRKFRNAGDCGGHIGTWSVDLAKRFNKVIIFEPMDLHRNCLVWNMKERGLENFELYPYCLGEKEGWVTLIEDKECSGNVHIDPNKKDGTHEVRLLDSFELNDLDFLKIDVEGLEIEVLKGAIKTLNRCRPIVNIEEKSHCERFGYKRYAASEYLISIGMVQLGRCIDDIVFGWK